MQIHNRWTVILRYAGEAGINAQSALRIFFAAALLTGAVLAPAQTPIPNPQTGNTLIPNTYPNNQGNQYNQGNNYPNNQMNSQNFGSQSIGGSQGMGSQLQSHFGDRSSHDSQSRTDTTRTNKAVKGAVGKGARAKGKNTIATRKGGGGKGGGGAKTVPLPDITADPKLVEDALFFTPSFIDVSTGDRFVTTLSYYNSKVHKIKEVDLWLHYDPKLIAPIWVNTDPVPRVNIAQAAGPADGPPPTPEYDARLGTYAKGPVESRYWPEQGFIHIHAELTSSPLGNIADFADLHWRALNPALGARIDLVGPAGQVVAVRERGINLVAGNGRHNNQKVNVDVNITPLDWNDPGLRTAEQVEAMMEAPPMGKLDRLRLAIVPGQEDVPAGEISTADVMMINPKGAALDDLRMRIRYDPTAITILDADEENYIADGINIFDGDFHKKFAFDGHVSNLVDPERGIIDYQVGSVMGPRVYPSGTFARIVFRMKRQAGKAFFWFEAEDPQLHVRMTDVTAYGRSLLGETTEVATQALHGAEIAVRPMDLSHPDKKKTTTLAETVKK